MEFVGIGDPHFDAPISKYIPHYNDVLASEMAKVFKYAMDNGVEHVIIFGDVAEKPRLSYEAFLALFNLLVNHKELQLHIILGNHCKRSKDSSVGHAMEIFMPFLPTLLPHVHIYTEDTRVKLDNVNFNFLPWPSTDFCKKSVNIAHIEVNGCKTDTGKEFKAKDLHSGKELILSGHIHTKHQVRNTYYVSTLMQQDFGEKEERYFVHVKTTGPKSTEVNYIRHKPKYTLRTIVIDTKEDLKTIPKKEQCLVRLIIRDGADVDPTMWLKYPNVVQHSAYKSKEELQTVLTEGLSTGADIQFEVQEFIEAYLESTQIDKDVIKTILEKREAIIKGA